jgi:imidazolonepropionase
MPKVTLIRGARQLLTLRGPAGPRRGADLGNLGIIQDGAVLIAGGRIAEVGPSRRLENLALSRDAEEIDASGCVVMPGFVDSNVPLVSNSHELSARALKTLAARGIEDAIRHGTTAIEAKSEAGLSEASATKVLRVQAALRDLPITVVSTFLAPDERSLGMPRTRRLADFVEISSEDEALLATARKLGWVVKLKVDAGERGAIRFSRSETVVPLTPIPSFLANQSQPPARMLIDNGTAVAIASGVRPANMQTAIALACRYMNMTAAEAITASTINGAYAMGQARAIGSIESGKSADVVILGVSDYRELPCHLGMNLVNVTMVRGSVRVEKPKVKWPER